MRLRLLLAFVLILVSPKSFSQILFNKDGDGVAFIKDENIYKIDGTPLGYFYDGKIYSFTGKLLGWWNADVFYDKNGLVYLFTKSSSFNITKPDPIIGFPKPLPAKLPMELALIKPIFKQQFSSERVLISNNSGVSNVPVANYDPNYYELPVYEGPNLNITLNAIQEAQKRSNNFDRHLKSLIESERSKSRLGQTHLNYFKTNKKRFTYNVTISNTFSKKVQAKIIKLRKKRIYDINFKVSDEEVFVEGYLGTKKFLSKKYNYKKYIYGHIFLSFKSDHNGFEGTLLNIYNGALSSVKYNRIKDELLFFEKNITAKLLTIK